MNEKTNIIYADGRQVQADLICYIENVANNKRYVYYTLNETVGTGANSTVKIYVANIKMNNPALNTEITADEWGTLKGYMGDALKDNANPNIRYISPAEMGPNVTIVSDRAIAMPISYDYINKQRGIYATAIAVPTAEPSAPATSEPAPEVSEPTPAPEPAPVVEPTPMIQETPAPQPETVSAPATEPSPTIEPADTSASNEQPVPLADTTNVNEEIVQENVGNAPQLEPIDIDAIEAKYKEMYASLENLKNQEIEAAKRYNATIELSIMHNEQHASYVQNEVQKEIPVMESAPIANSAPSIEANPVPVAGAPLTPEPAPVVEPTPVATTVPEPAPAVTETQLETNWFDMPAA